MITDTEKVRYLCGDEPNRVKRARAPGEAACRLGQADIRVHCLTIAEKISASIGVEREPQRAPTARDIRAGYRRRD